MPRPPDCDWNADPSGLGRRPGMKVALRPTDGVEHADAVRSDHAHAVVAGGLESAASRSAPAGPVSPNPEPRTSRPRTPRLPHACATSTTAEAGTASTARSGTSGTAATSRSRSVRAPSSDSGSRVDVAREPVEQAGEDRASHRPVSLARADDGDDRRSQERPQAVTVAIRSRAAAPARGRIGSGGQMICSSDPVRTESTR